MSDAATKTATTVISRASYKKIKECKTLQEAFETKELRELIDTSAPKHMNGDVMLRTFIQAASKSPNIYRCDLRQALGAFMSLTHLGLVPATVLNQAHLIPFKNNYLSKKKNEDVYDLQLIIGYPGYIDLAFRSGFVRDMQTGVVYPGEFFEHEKGTEKYLRHRQNIDMDSTTMTPRCVYAVATMADGTEFEIMTWPEIARIRDRSQAYRTAVRAKEEAEEKGWRVPATWTETPWVRDAPEMGRKTLIRRIAKMLPKCPELRAGVAIEDAQDAGKRLDYGMVIDGEATPMDGIPEVQDEQQEQQQEQRQEPKQESKTTVRTTRSKTKTEASDPRDSIPPAGEDKKQEPSFDEVLVSQYGEIDSEHTSEMTYAHALVRVIKACDPEDRPNVFEQNEDAIEKLKAMPAAWKLVEPLFDEDDQAEVETGGDGQDDEDAELVDFGPIAPPMGRGDKTDWPGWLKLIREAMVTIHGDELLQWLEPQRPHIEASPMAQRAQAVKSIREAFGIERVQVPQWLAEAISTKGKNQSEKDASWVEDRLSDIAKMMNDPKGRLEFDALTGSMQVKTVMARMRHENAPLYDRLNEAFGKKNRALPPAVPVVGG
jgi:recombination protein RecT